MGKMAGAAGEITVTAAHIGRTHACLTDSPAPFLAPLSRKLQISGRHDKAAAPETQHSPANGGLPFPGP